MLEYLKAISNESIKNLLHFDLYIISYTSSKEITTIVYHLFLEKWKKARN